MEVVAALLWREGRFLLCQRPAHKARGLQWEFVGGKVEPGETSAEALVRECREELGITVRPGPLCAALEYSDPDLRVHLSLLHCTLAAGEPRLLEHIAMVWVAPGEAEGYDLCPADRELLAAIKTRIFLDTHLGK